MADGTAASRDEIGRALEALTPGQLLKMKHFAAWRMRGLGRAACGRIWEDLLSEAWPAILEGATACHSLSDPHSSDSKWLKLMWRNSERLMSFETALANFHVHCPQPSVEQERFIVFHQKMLEPQNCCFEQRSRCDRCPARFHERFRCRLSLPPQGLRG